MSKNIAVFGTGALGGHVAAYLARNNHRVTVIDAWPENIDRIKSHGITLQGLTDAECFTASPLAALHLTEVQELKATPGFDIVFLAVKSYDTLWATTMIADYLAPSGFVVSLQNAINEERIAGVVGWGRTVGCIASKIVVELTGPGHVARYVAKGDAQHTVFRVGECHGRVTPRVTQVADMLSVCDSAKTTTNLWGERWTKLAVNCMRNSLAAATGRGGNANDRDPTTRQVGIRLCGEVLAVAQAHGIALEKAYGVAPVDAIAAASGDTAAMARCEDVIVSAIGQRSEAARSSMGQDVAKGRRTEIDYLNGYVVEKAKDVGLAAPVNAALTEVVRSVEAKRLAPSPDVVAGLSQS
ncbi:MAG: 2-dehydropantoate 2-reductase [Pseudomonadota bacterium]